MEVDRGRATSASRTAEHAGHAYYFCSDTCRTKFLANPAAYVKPPAAPTAASAVPVLMFTRPVVPATAPTSRTVPEPADPVELSSTATGRTIFRKDPVCGADVDTTDVNVLKSTYNGSTFYFLTEQCRAEFQKSPGRYAK